MVGQPGLSSLTRGFGQCRREQTSPKVSSQRAPRTCTIKSKRRFALATIPFPRIPHSASCPMPLPLDPGALYLVLFFLPWLPVHTPAVQCNHSICAPDR